MGTPKYEKLFDNTMLPSSVVSSRGSSLLGPPRSRISPLRGLVEQKFPSNPRRGGTLFHRRSGDVQHGVHQSIHDSGTGTDCVLGDVICALGGIGHKLVRIILVGGMPRTIVDRFVRMKDRLPSGISSRQFREEFSEQ